MNFCSHCVVLNRRELFGDEGFLSENVRNEQSRRTNFRPEVLEFFVISNVAVFRIWSLDSAWRTEIFF